MLTPSELKKAYAVHCYMFTPKGEIDEISFEETTGTDLQASLNNVPRHELPRLIKGFEQLDNLAKVDINRPLEQLQSSIEKELKALSKCC
ncbi:hypothetical protein GU926_01950 [Nibribacter ruber]|uniref:Uncharacterized protein n=1 Tax=Nibribacter ruber TaxID=2698458 RepID=A0A6P1NZC1_9BACT|nr:hypothetical protein [Nibribacter ruber]QHL86273.1 hypothetical protein GU926_01950 [Nibribacter ruber]